MHLTENTGPEVASTNELTRRAEAYHASCVTFHQSLLAKAFRGELVPQDPDDEPASALLERIRKEREVAAGDGQRKRGRQVR